MISKMVKSIRETWTDMEYAQRRLIEIRTGVPQRGALRTRSAVRDLERLWASQPHGN